MQINTLNIPEDKLLDELLFATNSIEILKDIENNADPRVLALLISNPILSARLFFLRFKPEKFMVHYVTNDNINLQLNKTFLELKETYEVFEVVEQARVLKDDTSLVRFNGGNTRLIINEFFKVNANKILFNDVSFAITNGSELICNLNKLGYILLRYNDISMKRKIIERYISGKYLPRV